eukprot:11226616-Lingulodinium_polyedra.AAC.1
MPTIQNGDTSRTSAAPLAAGAAETLSSIATLAVSQREPTHPRDQASSPRHCTRSHHRGTHMAALVEVYQEHTT